MKIIAIAVLLLMITDVAGSGEFGGAGATGKFELRAVSIVGSNNIAIGIEACRYIATGSDNIFIGEGDGSPDN